MSSELEQLLREHARQLDAEMSPITALEITSLKITAQPSRRANPSPTMTYPSRSWGRRLSIAAGVTVIAGAGLFVARLDDNRPRIVTPGATGAPTTAPGAPSAPPSSAPPAPAPISAPVVVTTPVTVTTPVSSTPLEPEITADEVQLAQREALRNLTGFRATASFTYTGDSAGSVQPDAVTYTLLANGAVYIDTGPDTFGSFDPATGIVLGVFRDEAGNLNAQEITGQTENGLPLTILGGYDPTRLVETGRDSMQTILEVEVEGRPSWEVTFVEDFSAEEFASAPFDTDVVQTTIQIIDQESGLIVSSAESSTDPNFGSNRVTTLSGITVVDTMPSEFPGTLPSGVEVDRSGSTAPITGATVDDVVELFGVAVPIPEGLIAGTVAAGGPVEIVLEDRPQFEAADDPDGEPRTTFRAARFTVREGFVATTVALSSIALREGAAVPAGLAVSEGYLCFDADGDEVCNFGGDPQGFTDGEDLVPIVSGLLADLSAEMYAPGGALGSGSTYYGPFSISVSQSDRTTIEAILGSFELVEPSS